MIQGRNYIASLKLHCWFLQNVILSLLLSCMFGWHWDFHKSVLKHTFSNGLLPFIPCIKSSVVLNTTLYNNESSEATKRQSQKENKMLVFWDRKEEWEVVYLMGMKFYLARQKHSKVVSYHVMYKLNNTELWI